MHAVQGLTITRRGRKYGQLGSHAAAAGHEAPAQAGSNDNTLCASVEAQLARVHEGRQEDDEEAFGYFLHGRPSCELTSVVEQTLQTLLGCVACHTCCDIYDYRRRWRLLKLWNDTSQRLS